MLFVVVAPALWILLELATRPCEPGTAAAAVGRIGILTFGASLWWVVGLRVQGAYGLPVLQLTETVRVVARRRRRSTCCAGSATGSSTAPTAWATPSQQSHDYVTDHLVMVLSFAVPVVALAAAAIVRWRHRTYLVLLVVAGTIIGVGAWPYDDPSLYGRAWKSFSDQLLGGSRAAQHAARRAA